MNTESKERIIAEINHIFDSGLFNHPEDKKTAITNLTFIFCQEQEQLLENLLENGHGGGNWRRLILIKLSKFKKSLTKNIGKI